MKTYYPNFVREFSGWINKYWDVTDRTASSKLKNKVVYHVKDDIKDYKLAVIDFISGMTDQFALRAFDEIVRF